MNWHQFKKTIRIKNVGVFFANWPNFVKTIQHCFICPAASHLKG
jgi:hypothetical protein